MSNPEEQAKQAAIEAAQAQQQQEQQLQQQQQQEQQQQQQPTTTPIATDIPAQQQQTPEQTAKDQQATQKIEKTIDENKTDKVYKTNLRTLQRIVAQASPIIEDKETTQTIKDPDGNDIQKPVKQKITTGYNYYAVDGKPVEQWVQETFGGKVTLDKKNRKITVNDQVQPTK